MPEPFRREIWDRQVQEHLRHVPPRPAPHQWNRADTVMLALVLVDFVLAGASIAYGPGWWDVVMVPVLLAIIGMSMADSAWGRRWVHGLRDTWRVYRSRR